eukprot:GHVN01026127.1.p1 GENE.GHVN01026127.1~~GHVN01026127.1.p1  ORF type:complete len:197 (+),score=5.23 GHVN01026127.1:269-859(+)
MKETGALTQFYPMDERAFEDWVDLTARKIRAWGVCLPLFKEIWCAAGGEAFSQIIANSEATTYEELVSEVALKLFPYSLHVREVEESLWSPARAPSVYQAVLNHRSQSKIFESKAKEGTSRIYCESAPSSRRSTVGEGGHWEHRLPAVHQPHHRHLATYLQSCPPPLATGVGRPDTGERIAPSDNIGATTATSWDI